MTTPPISPRKFDLPRVFAILFRPRMAFAEAATETRSTWSTPMIVLTVTAILAVTVTGYLRSKAAMMGEIPLPPDWQWWTPEMQNNYMQGQQLTQGPVFMYVMPLVGSLGGLWLGWLVLAGLLHLGSTLFGGRGSMQSALNVVAWASLPFAVRDLLRVIFMLSVGKTIASPGLAGFATAPGFATQLLSRTDLFLLWNLILLVIGFAVADNLPRGKSFANVFIVILLLLLAQAGLGGLLSNVGNSAIQRPFF